MYLSRCKNWQWRVVNHLNKYECVVYTRIQDLINKSKITDDIHEKMMIGFRSEWAEIINIDQSTRRQGDNKLQKYKLL